MKTIEDFRNFRKELIIAIQCDIAALQTGDFELDTTATSVKVTQGVRSVEVGNIVIPDEDECIFQGYEKPDWSFLNGQGYDFLIDALKGISEVGVYHKRLKLFSVHDGKDYFILTLGGFGIIRLELFARIEIVGNKY